MSYFGEKDSKVGDNSIIYVKGNLISSVKKDFYEEIRINWNFISE